MLTMYWTARIYTVNLENQSSANLRARAHFESVVGTAAAAAISGAVDRSPENIANWASYLPTDCVAAIIGLDAIARRDVTKRVHVPTASCRLTDWRECP
jgi:hypothetical protein